MRAVVERGVEAELAQVRDLVGAARDADRAGAEDPGQLPTVAPTGPLAAATTTVSPGLGWPIWVSPA